MCGWRTEERWWRSGWEGVWGRRVSVVASMRAWRNVRA
jgi:hypothetical protein